MSHGFLYICANDDLLDEALASVKSLKRVMPDANVSIITDANNVSSKFDRKIDLDQPMYGWGDKVRNMSRSPYVRTIFIDTDTYFINDIYEVYEILDRFDIAAAQDPGRDYFHQNVGIGPIFPEYNTGVVAYNSSEKVNEFFEDWKTIYKRHRTAGVTADQPAFRKAIFESNLHLCSLPPEYNCRTNKAGYLKGPAKILHGRHERPFQEIANKINQTNERRIFASIGDDVGVFSQAKATPLRWLWFSLASNGFMETFRIIKEEFLR